MASRLYSLFDKVDGKYIRQIGLAYRKDTAVRVFQNRLIDGCLDGKGTCLRAVKQSYTLEQIVAAAAGSTMSVHECCKLLDKQNVENSR